MMMIWLGIGGALAALTMTLPLRWAAAIVILCLPLNGTAVAMLGGDPIILPLVVTAGFLLRWGFTLFEASARRQFIGLARNDIVLIAFLAYCIVSGLFFPRLFAGETMIFPQAFVVAAVPLGPQSVAVAQIGYLTCAILLVMALRHTILRVGLETLVIGLLVQIALIGGLAIVQAGLGLGGVRMPTNWIANNTAYGLLAGALEQGFVRVTSVFVEASAFASWASGAVAFCYALFVNRIAPRISLALMAIVGVAMLLSTSSTAYFGLLVVGAYAVMSAFLDPDRRRRDRALMVVGIGGFVAVAATIVVFSTQDGFLGQFREMIENVTIRKVGGQSWSAIERGMWNQTAMQNAMDTGLLGAGYGAVRASGLFFTLIGGVGAPGLVLFLGVMLPLVLRALRRPRNGEEAVASAGGFALCGALGSLIVAGADLSLSHMFWVYAAIAAAPLTQRWANRTARQSMMGEATDLDAPGEQPQPS